MSRSLITVLAAATLLSAALPRASALPLASCPKIPTVDAKKLGSLRLLRLNRHVNAGYGRFAECFQGIAEGNAPRESFGKTLPVWYAFAPYASRVVGASEATLQSALSAAAQLAASPKALLDGKASGAVKRFVRTFLAAVAVGGKGANLDAMFTPAVLASTASCVAGVLWDAPAQVTLAGAMNWAGFNDRWPSILDAFRAVYAAPGTPWPMPNPDPTKDP